MISEKDADKVDQWLKDFQKEHGGAMIVDDNVIKDLACALCDDIPLGYEGSHRLANWLFCHLNVPKISKDLCGHIQYMANHQEDAEERLNKAFDDYKRCTNELMTIFQQSLE